MKWIGLTGGIASGKSTAAKLIQSLGFCVIDADQVSFDLTQKDQPAYLEIKSHFGAEYFNLDAGLDRAKLGALVFSDSVQKSRLESILHPLIKIEVQKKRQAFANEGQTLCFYDVPLLFEKNMQQQFDKTVLVWCEPHLQLERLMKRNSLSRDEALLRISNQLPLIDKVKLVDFCLDNSSDDLELLRVQIMRFAKQLSNI